LSLARKRAKKRAKKRSANLVIFGILLLICIFGGVYFFNGQKPAGSIKVDTSNSGNIQTAAAEKVTIKAYLNLASNCETNKQTIDLLDGLVREYKGQVSVEYIDFSTKGGAERTRADGLSCAGLVINGSQTYVIDDNNGKQREVTFSHPINEQWTADDVKAVVKLLLGK
jgi:thiol-disulfide isomerase/thioredoxin